jgi:spermidine/putrescine transport system substrate-binding protein
MTTPISRRHAIMLGATGLAAPLVLRAQDALASSGSVRVFSWLDYIQPNIAEKFTAETGITLELTTFGSNDEALSVVTAAGGRGFDVAFPSITVVPSYLDAAGETFFAEVPAGVNTAAIIPSFLRDSAVLGGVFRGRQVALPFSWGTEGVTFNRAILPIADADVSYGDLFRPGTEGKAAFRQGSVLFGVGLHLDAAGLVPSNRMLDVYKSEEEARRVFSAVTNWIVERREHFGAFWNNATEAKAAFRDAGCIIGQTWDTTGLLLNRENPDFVYRAPKEGIITWCDSMAMLREAPNPEQAVAFINFMLRPEVAAMFSNNTGYNTAVVGAADFATEVFKRQFNEVYRPDVLNNMWWWQAAVPHLAPVRNEFIAIITNA